MVIWSSFNGIRFQTHDERGLINSLMDIYGVVETSPRPYERSRRARTAVGRAFRPAGERAPSRDSSRIELPAVLISIHTIASLSLVHREKLFWLSVHVNSHRDHVLQLENCSGFYFLYGFVLRTCSMNALLKIIRL